MKNYWIKKSQVPEQKIELKSGYGNHYLINEDVESVSVQGCAASNIRIKTNLGNVFDCFVESGKMKVVPQQYPNDEREYEIVGSYVEKFFAGQVKEKIWT